MTNKNDLIENKKIVEDFLKSKGEHFDFRQYTNCHIPDCCHYTIKEIEYEFCIIIDDKFIRITIYNTYLQSMFFSNYKYFNIKNLEYIYNFILQFRYLFTSL